MHLHFLKGKLHQAHVTHVELEYEGSCAIDRTLLAMAGILENEQIHIYNLANGERWITYAIAAPAGSGIVSVNGAAAHKAEKGDRVIICAYALYTEEEVKTHQPRVVRLGKNNIPVGSQPESVTYATA
jgi:aspartate 1-decarboxylase